MSYTPRYNCPEEGNKYYNTISNGGYSTCIQGNTKMSCFNPKLNVLPNCVGYASGRMNEIGQYEYFKYAIPGNAEDWYENAQKMGFEVGSAPRVGAVMVWQKGKLKNGSDGPGHVAVVEKVNSKTSVITSESGWGVNKLFWTTNRSKGVGNWGMSGYKFLGFIYHPDVEREYLSLGDEGNDVKELQKQLNEFGWYDLVEDGNFGYGTQRAVKDMQKKLNLTVDGIYGQASKKQLNEALICPKDAKPITILVNGKQRKLNAHYSDGHNYIQLNDMYYKFNYAKVSYNQSKGMPQVDKL